MFNWLRRRRLSTEARRKLLIVAARSEEAIIETHVANALELLRSVGGEVDLDRGIELYVEMMSLSNELASTVTTRILARVEHPGTHGSKPRGRRFENAFGDKRKS
jgi:6,7-dimethyl-8-ribityllumazine synthase